MTTKAVVYTINQTNIELIATSLFSLINYYNSKEKLNVFLLVDDIFEEDINSLRSFSKYMKKEHIEISIWQMPQELNQLTSLDTAGGLTRYNTAKFFLPNYFANVDTLVYLEAETLILGNISQYFSDFSEEYAVGAVKQALSNTGSEFFNTASMIFNPKMYNEKYSVDELIAVINNSPATITEIEMSNQLFKEAVYYLPTKYNVTDASQESVNDRAKQECVVRNFADSQERFKPWNHLALMNKWDRAFWTNFTEMKTLVFRGHASAKSL